MEEKITKNNKALLKCVSRGYYIDTEGKAFNPKGKEVRGTVNIGYKNLRFRIDGKMVSVPFHRLQAYQKYKDVVLKKDIQVRHLDGIRLNNRWDNIAIGTQSDNMMDRPKKERKKHAIKAIRSHQESIRSTEERELIYKYLSEGKPYNWIIENTNITSKGTLSYMKNSSTEYKEYLNRKNR